MGRISRLSGGYDLVSGRLHDRTDGVIVDVKPP
jgi:hypothetical protein